MNNSLLKFSINYFSFLLLLLINLSCSTFNFNSEDREYYIVTLIDTSFFKDYNLIKFKKFRNYENSENYYVFTKKDSLKFCKTELKLFDKIYLGLQLNDKLIYAKSKDFRTGVYKIQEEVIWQDDTVKIKNFNQNKIKGICNDNFF